MTHFHISHYLQCLLLRFCPTSGQFDYLDRHKADVSGSLENLHNVGEIMKKALAAVLILWFHFKPVVLEQGTRTVMY